VARRSALELHRAADRVLEDHILRVGLETHAGLLALDEAGLGVGPRDLAAGAVIDGRFAELERDLALLADHLRRAEAVERLVLVEELAHVLGVDRHSLGLPVWTDGS